MSMGYDATASLPPLNYTTSFTNPAQWTMNNNAYLNQYSQGVLGQTLLDTQRSQQHTADLITSAAMAMPNSPGGAYMFSDTGGPAGGWGGNAFNSGAMSNFMTGGGGYNFPSIPDMSGGLGGGGGQQQPINWGSLFGQGVGGMSGGGNANPFPGMSMPGGLNSPMTMPQQQPMDWGSLFGRGAGGMGSGATADPYPAMSMPGGLNSPMSGMDAPMEGAPSSTSDWSDLFKDTGMTMPGGLNSPMTVPEAQAPAYDYGSLFGKGTEGAPPPAPDGTRTYDLAPMFEGGGGGGFGTGGADTSQLFGGAATGQGGNAFSYNPEPTGSQDVFGQSADALAAQARGQLAGLMGGGDTQPAETVEGPTGRTAESAREAGGAVQPAAAARPAETTPGRQEALAALKKELQANDLIMTSGYRGPEHPLSQANPNSAHSQGRAFDVRARTPEAADTAIGQIRQLLGARGLQEGRDYRIIDEVRHPSGWATGPHVHTQFTEEGIQKYQQGVYQDPNPPRPPEDIPYPQGIPLPAERPAEAPARPETAAAPLEQGPGVNAGQEIPRPPADIPPPGLVGPGYNALDAAANPPAPVKHTGLELARANIDTPIEQIARERFGQKGVDEVSSMVRGMTPRQIYESYGGMFTSRAEPLFKGLGITRQDFEKAVTMPQAKQDLKMRFGEGFGGMGGEEPSAGAFSPFEGFRQSTDFEDRRNELAQLQASGISYGPGPEVASTPLGMDLGLGDLSGAEGATFNERFGAFPQPEPVYSGGGIGSDWTAGRGQQKQTTELEWQRAPMLSQLEDNEGLRNKLFATMIDEMGTGASDQDYAAVAESLFNRAAAKSSFDNLDVSGLLGGTLNKEKYYEGQRSGTDNVMGSKYLDKLNIVRNDLALQARLWDIIQQEVGRGSNFSVFGTDNASAALARDRLANPGKYGYGGTDFRPGNPGNPGGEHFFRADNPLSDPRGRDYVGDPVQRNTREWYQNLEPFTRYPPGGR